MTFYGWRAGSGLKIYMFDGLKIVVGVLRVLIGSNSHKILMSFVI